MNNEKWENFTNCCVIVCKKNYIFTNFILFFNLDKKIMKNIMFEAGEFFKFRSYVLFLENFLLRSKDMHLHA